MAIVIDKASLGSTYGSASASSIALVTTQAVASNGFIVIGGGWDGDNSLGVTVSGGGLTWTTDKIKSSVGNSTTTFIASAQAPSGLASSTTITATITGAIGARAISGLSFTGVATSSPVDGTPDGPNDASTAAWTTGNYTIAAGSAIVAVAFSIGTSGGSTPTSPSIEAWQITDAGDVVTIVCEYRIEAGSGSFPVAGTFAGAGQNTNLAVAYKVAAGGGGSTVALEWQSPKGDPIPQGWRPGVISYLQQNGLLAAPFLPTVPTLQQNTRDWFVMDTEIIRT